jgi:hypothetical protein
MTRCRQHTDANPHFIDARIHRCVRQPFNAACTDAGLHMMHLNMAHLGHRAEKPMSAARMVPAARLQHMAARVFADAVCAPFMRCGGYASRVPQAWSLPA